MKQEMKDATWYALADFHNCIVTKKHPMLDVSQGARAAITVHLANEAMYNHSVQTWKEGQ